MKFNINKDRLTIENLEEKVSSSINFYITDVEFDESWNGLIKEARLIKAKEEIGTARSVIDDTIAIDVKEFGLYSIGFVGYRLNENNEKVFQISTDLKKIPYVKGAGEIETEDIELPSAEDWELYIAQIQELVGNKQDKLIAGKNITIDENNVISSTGGGGEGGTSYHDELKNLDYESSGHIGFQKELVSGINIKTLNNQDILGEGNIDINSAIWGNIAGSIQNQTDLQEVLEDKASKDFVNSSVATATGTFKGTFDNLQDLLGTLGNKNDYAFYQETVQTGERVYHRYKHNGEQWLFEYSLNDSSFTAEQWATINSGLTRQSLEGKQDLLISGYNIKTINNQDITGNGNIDIEGVTDHNELENLDFENSGHTGFQKQLKAGPNIIIDADGTISASAQITETEFEMWYEEEVESWK